MSYLTLGRKEVLKGKRGERAFAKYLEKICEYEEVEVWNNPNNFQGVDIVVRDKNGKPIKVFEVTNYNKKNWFSKTRAKRYKDSLNRWKTINPNIYRAVVVSYPNTVDKIKGIRKMFADEGIEVWVFKETR